MKRAYPRFLDRNETGTDGDEPIIPEMLVSEFDYVLPPERIAQEPLPDRAASRLLHLRRSTETWNDQLFREFPDFLREDDLVRLIV